MTSDKTVIWATDGSAEAEAAFEHGRRLLSSARYVAVHCDQLMTGRGSGYSMLADEDELRGALKARVEELRNEGLEIELVVRRGHESPADSIAAVAAERNADSIICGTRGLGAVSGALLGSVAQRLLHVAPCPVVAVPDRLGAPKSGKAKHEAVKA